MDCTEHHSNLPYSELLPGEEFPDSPINTKGLLKAVNSYLTSITYDPEKLAEPHHEQVIPDDGNAMIQELEFDVGDVNTYDLFRTLNNLKPDLSEIRTGIFAPREGIVVNNFENTLRIDVHQGIFDPTVQEFSVTLRETIDQENPERKLLEIVIHELQSTIKHYLAIAEEPARSNLFYFREDGFIRIFGDVTSQPRYLINRANSLQGIAIDTIKAVLKLLKSSR